METLLTSALLLVIAPVTVWTGFVAAEVLAAGATVPGAEPINAPRRRVGVIIPAHDEALAIAGTIQDVLAQLQPGDRLLVVADNCSDDTASVASAHGAEVVERFDLSERGKGFALEFGLRALGKRRELDELPLTTVIIIDADCRLGAGSIDRLATTSEVSQRPVQALDLMLRPATGSPFHGLSAFAWRVKNLARPLGLSRMGLPCQLMGTGMAFPWELISTAQLGTAHIVEDLKLGLELAAAGRAPLFCPSAVVTSYFPASKEGAAKQRERWEGGHLQIIGTVALPALVAGLRSRNRDLFVLALDASVPPLTLLGLSLVLGTAISSGFTSLGHSAVPAYVSGATSVVYAATLVLAWTRFGRSVLPARDLGAIPSYLLGKLRLYGRLAAKRGGSEWVRAERGVEERRRE